MSNTKYTVNKAEVLICTVLVISNTKYTVNKTEVWICNVKYNI